MDENVDLNNLEFHEKLGEGGGGTVSRVTFKKPFKGYTEAAAKAVWDLREEEVEIMRKLHHPHIVEWLAFYKNGPINVILIEYGGNGSLHDYLSDKTKSLPEILMRKWLKESAAAIKYLHDLNVLHRDIKPHNCILFNNNILKMCDFGLARTIEQSQTTSTAEKGTYYYMAPEIFMANKEGRAVYSKPADIFSYGMLTLQITKRKSPWEEVQYPTVMFKVTSGERPAIPSTCPQDILELIQRCWDHDPQKRPTIQDIIDGRLEDVGLPTDEQTAGTYLKSGNTEDHDRERKRQVPNVPSHARPHTAPPPVPATHHAPSTARVYSIYYKKTKKEEKKVKKDKKGKLTKGDMGTPQDFKHVSHVGWDPELGFDVDGMDPQVKDWFKTTGVSEDQLGDQNTTAFIKDFIDSQGGIDAVEKDIERMGPVVTRELPPLPRSSRGGASPPPPSPVKGSAPPPPTPTHVNLAAAPPPPPPPRGPDPSTRTSSRSAARATPIPSRGLAPAPPAAPSAAPMGSPPPPPLMSWGGGDGGRPLPRKSPPPPPSRRNKPPLMGDGPPLPPVGRGGGEGGGGGRRDVLSQIQTGVSLHQTFTNEDIPARSGDARGALLDQIQTGIKLRPVDEMDPQVKDWFQAIGVSEDQLRDQNTAGFIKDFIDSHGGIDAVKKDVERIGPVVTRELPPLPRNGRGGASTPPPSPVRGSAPPPPPPAHVSLAAAPPPPPPPPHLEAQIYQPELQVAVQLVQPLSHQ